MSKKSLSMDVKVGQSVAIDGGRVILTVESKSGQLARIRFEHVDGVDVRRHQPNKASVAARGGVTWSPMPA